MADSLREILEAAARNGEVIRIVYHGGSQSGTAREVTPISVGEDRMRARDFASHATKVFMLDKITLPCEDDRPPEYEPPSPLATPPLAQLIAALGIPYVGERAGRSLAEEFGTMERLMEASGWELGAAPGIGPRLAENISLFFQQPENRQRAERMAAGAAMERVHLTERPTEGEELDPHGQAPNPWWHHRQRAERDVAEVLGITKGLLADGKIVEEEARYLNHWVAVHPDAITRWPIEVLAPRLRQIFADGMIDEAERADLADLLTSIAGGKAGVIAGEDATTALPLDVPPPAIVWAGSVFVFTGKFAFGTRTACEMKVEERGGICEDNITQRTRYLVLGTFGSRDWVQTSFGRKIEAAVKLKDRGFPLAIVNEEHWAHAAMA
jgi:NAD-dependent DNA ligase